MHLTYIEIFISFQSKIDKIRTIMLKKLYIAHLNKIKIFKRYFLKLIFKRL